MPLPNMVHYTEGGLWHGYTHQDYVSAWMDELKHLLAGGNPKADARSTENMVGVTFGDVHGYETSAR